MKHVGSEWIKAAFKVECSPLGTAVADLLGDVFQGVYHLDEKSLRKTNWSDKFCISVTLPYLTLSTFDSANLTWLVVLCHDRCLRMSIKAKTINYLELTFHQRNRDGGISQSHPTIESHIERIRECVSEPADM